MDHHEGPKEHSEVIRRQNDVTASQNTIPAFPSINHLVNQLGYFISQTIVKPVSNVINAVKQELERQLESCFHSLGRPFPSSASSILSPAGRKVGIAKGDQQKILIT